MADADGDDRAINLDPDENRKLAAHLLSTFRETQSMLLGFAVDISKWVLTSLLAINGGGLIAIWPVEMDRAFKLASCAAFVVGILSALACGFALILRVGKASRPLSQAIGYWATVEVDGMRVSKLEELGALEKFGKTPVLTMLFGWLAPIMFCLGVVIAGIGALGISDREGQIVVLPAPSR